MQASIEELIYKKSLSNPTHRAAIDVSTGEVWSYCSLWDKITKASSWYKEKGLKRGDRILLSASKDLGFLPAYFGAHLSGLITVPIDPETNPDRLEMIIETATPALIIGFLRHGEGKSLIGFDEIGKNTKTLSNIGFPDMNAISDILFTTGTTGKPKGVALSTLNESSAAENINTFIGNTSDDIELVALPISHSFGLGRIRCVLCKGGTLVLLGSFASMKRFYKAIEDYKITGFGMVPASWAYISKMSGDRISKYAGQIRYVEIGSAPMPHDEKIRLTRLLPETRICMHYGLTEASRSVFINFQNDSGHLDTAGKAAPNVEIAIFSNSGERLQANIEGEVCVKGNHVCSDYWGMSEKDFRKDFFGKWFRTGDWGSLSEDGWLLLKGRNKEMINVGGKKVNPIEVEEKLLSYPGIVDCACISSPDRVMGEVVKACIVESSSTNDEEIKNYLSKLLENYKVPVVIERIGEIPRTSSGKIQRLKLK